MTMQEQMTVAFMKQVTAKPEGQAYFLTQCARSEDNGESALFDKVLTFLDDPNLQRMVARHQKDEIRHAAMFRECAQRTGVLADPPLELNVVTRLDEALGGFFSRPVRNAQDVMETYLMLQVVEERATTLFPLFAEVFKDFDPRVAAVFTEIDKDEERHLMYCRAISRRYAPSRALMEDTLRDLRETEARVFTENNKANMTYILDNRLLAGSAFSRLGWRTVSALTRPFQGPLYTRFAQQGPGYVPKQLAHA